MTLIAFVWSKLPRPVCSTLLVAQILAVIVLLLNVNFVLLETVLFRTHGAKVFGVPKDQIEMRVAAMSNQACYNGFLVAAIALGLFWPGAANARAFMVYGLVFVIVAGIWGAATLSKKILFIQALPVALALALALALVAFFLAKDRFYRPSRRTAVRGAQLARPRAHRSGSHEIATDETRPASGRAGLKVATLGAARLQLR